ncbi:MAG TPA: hypothetical protein VLL94_07390, partial [Nitrospiraceae bacterium]|nr:hypothetical protein [Nitrospiraceae bacterium]
MESNIGAPRGYANYNIAEILLYEELPKTVKDRLLSGEYEITTRRMNDQQVVTLSPRDLVALDVDILNRQFAGSAGCYGEIAIRPRVGKTTPDTDENSKKEKLRTGPKTNRIAEAAGNLLDRLHTGELTVGDLKNKHAGKSIGRDYGLSETAALKARED